MGIKLNIREKELFKSWAEIGSYNEIENIFTEISLKSKKWLNSGYYIPKSKLNMNEYYFTKWENFTVLRDF